MQIRHRHALAGATVAVLVAVLAASLVYSRPADPGPGPDPDVPETDTPSPQPPTPPPGKRGLHYTDEELRIWRHRASSGPYRGPGDASENSPAEWQRIEDNAAAFLDDPSAGRWEGPSGEGCVQPSSEDVPPEAAASLVRDAAFYQLVVDDSRHRDAVKRELLAQAEEPGVDFGDRDRWCLGVVYDVAPGPSIAHWLTKLLFAYDYVGRDAFSTDEQERLDSWFSGAAEFLQEDADSALDANFRDRFDGDYRLSSERAEDLECEGRTAYYDSDQICAIARYYNNRRAAQIRYVGLVGLHQDDESFKRSARLFVREFLMFSVFPDGFYGEFERWRESLPDLGWAYATNTAGAVITIADHFARAGDPSLYEYSTSDGRDGTEGGPKDLHFAITSLGRYVDGTYQRYATDDPSRVGDEDALINGRHDPADWESAHDVVLTPSNVYYRDPYIRALYTRSGDGMPPYPREPALNGRDEVWTGEAGVYPSVLFMFGQVEGEVWPYS